MITRLREHWNSNKGLVRKMYNDIRVMIGRKRKMVTGARPCATPEKASPSKSEGDCSPAQPPLPPPCGLASAIAKI